MIVQRILLILVWTAGFLAVKTRSFVSSGTSFKVIPAFVPSITSRRNADNNPEAGATNDNDIKEITENKSDSSNDILNSPAFLKRKLEVLQSDIAKVEAEIETAKEKVEAGKAEWGSQLEDLAKEYKTIQQRMTDQSSKSDDQAVMQVARQMLGVLDNFDRAFGQVTVQTEAEQSIKDEYQNVYNQILETFKKLGVEEVESVGKEFDYLVHQAVMQKPSEEYSEGIVCEELQKGFKIGDTLIRASMVVVAA